MSWKWDRVRWEGGRAQGREEGEGTERSTTRAPSLPSRPFPLSRTLVPSKTPLFTAHTPTLHQPPPFPSSKNDPTDLNSLPPLPSSRARFTDASELPQSKALESARLSTFGKWWPHDKKKAWLPTSKNVSLLHLVPRSAIPPSSSSLSSPFPPPTLLRRVSQLAKAGFIFSPNGKASDMASCLYCELGLDGWSPTDDPL